MSAQHVAEVLKLAEDFVKLRTAPRAAVVQRSSATASLPDQLATASRILRGRVDKLISKFRTTQPEFVAKYRTARVIVDRGGRNGMKDPTPPVPASVRAV